MNLRGKEPMVQQVIYVTFSNRNQKPLFLLKFEFHNNCVAWNILKYRQAFVHNTNWMIKSADVYVELKSIKINF